jgi:protein-S-isoprenylcysteine O-methyltransferase Ste14
MARNLTNIGLAVLLVLASGYTFFVSGPEGLDYWDAVIGVILTFFIVVNVLRRPAPVEQDTRWWVWIVCAASLYYFLAFTIEDPSQSGWQRPAYYGMLLSHALGGLGCVLLGMSFSILPARRTIRVHWLYRYVRHPIYAAYIVGDGCFVLLVPSAWNVVVWTSGGLLFVWRAHLEEKLLEHDEDYLQYRSRTPSRFLPGIY